MQYMITESPDWASLLALEVNRCNCCSCRFPGKVGTIKENGNICQAIVLSMVPGLGFEGLSSRGILFLQFSI